MHNGGCVVDNRAYLQEQDVSFGVVFFYSLYINLIAHPGMNINKIVSGMPKDLTVLTLITILSVVQQLS